MRIEYVKQSIIEAKTPDSLANTVIIQGCNNKGAMGSGVAKVIFDKWPLVRTRYKNQDTYELGTGEFVQVEFSTYVFNGITQDGYGYDGKKYAVPWAIGNVIKTAAAWSCDGDAFFMPKIGAGLGGLDWDTEVVPAIEAIDFNGFITVCVQG